jgi:hypothetical protein
MALKRVAQMKNETRNKLLLSGLVFLILCTPVVVFAIYKSVSANNSKDTLLVEAAKAFLQLVGVAILGGGIKLLYDDFMEQRRQAEKARDQERASAEKSRDQQRASQAAANDIRKGLLNDLIAARSRVEEARFRYRIQEAGDPVEQYRETVLSILEARLSLSRIWNAIQTSNYLFVKYEEIEGNINEMKEYLDTLINEYEDQVIKIQDLQKQEVAAHLRSLRVFGDFVNRNAQETNYGKKFLVESYRPAVGEIRREVLLSRELDVGA